jgi:hypothetical protein
MLFGSCNALSIFTILINLVFHDNLNEFVIIQINDISIYFKSIIEHAQHLEHYALQKLKDKFYVYHAKSEFAKLKMDFLGHVTLF